MEESLPETGANPDTGLVALATIAGYFRIAADPAHLARELALQGRPAGADDLLRAARLVGLKAGRVQRFDTKRLAALPAPTILALKQGGFAIYGGTTPDGKLRFVDPLTRAPRDVAPDEAFGIVEPDAVLLARRFLGAGADPKTFGFRWFLPSLWRYRRPIGHVLLASLFVQIFALVTPLFFQVVVDKVLTHRSEATLVVLVIGLALIGLFDVVLQYLRSYALSHTTNRLDVELGRRLFHHMLRLPLSYFETRPAGQTVARMRELETIRSFLTGQGLFCALDLLFAVVFIGVLFLYSTMLTLVVLATIPVYVGIAVALRPGLRDRIEEKFNRGAESQQFLVETVVGVQTVKAGAVEPLMQMQWEERLAAYVRTAFDATMLSVLGQNAIQYVSKATTILLMFLGARAVIAGELTVGQLIAFNMIAGQVSQPILRLSQLWQDFQQVQVSVERLGDILNHPPEATSRGPGALPPPKGAIAFSRVSFRYQPGGQEVIRGVSLRIAPGEVIGIVGPSGSGKSTLTKLAQRLYLPTEGQILIDGADLSQLDPSWLRSHIGVVLQENLLFNRSIHDNIAFANPALPRAAVIQVARLAGAHEFVGKLPMGYDTMIEERGANLSGGQRQRIAIARALATNPPILILDEATSALDYESERVVQANMRAIARGRTVLIIAHRLAAVRGCDRIFGMIDGRIVEEGDHQTLLKRPGGLYARLWALQSGEAEAEGVPA